MMNLQKITILAATTIFIACGSNADQTDPNPKRHRASNTKADELVFAVMGDSRGSWDFLGGGVYTYALTKALDHATAQQRAGLVIFTGDMVAGARSADHLAKQLKTWNATVQPYREKGVEFLITSGNHEIQDGTMKELEPGRLGSPTENALAHQKAVIAAFPNLPKNGPKGGGLTYWVRNFDTLFIMLDSYRPGYFHTVDTAWLKETLSGDAVNPKPSNIFVATHPPAFPTGGHLLDSLSNYNLDRVALKEKGVNTWPWKPSQGGPLDQDVDWRDKRDAFWKILSEHKVTAFFSGHEHNLSCQRIDGIWQIVSGALTKKLYAKNSCPLGLYNKAPQSRRAGNTLWSGSDKIWGYFLIVVKDSKVSAEIYGWTEKDEPVRLFKIIELS